MNSNLSQLPREPADRLTKPFIRFLRIEAMAGIVLLLCTFLALDVSGLHPTLAGVLLGLPSEKPSMKEAMV